MHCGRKQVRLVENTYRRNAYGDIPFRAVFVQVVCGGGTILAMEPVGHAEFVTDDYAMLCEPGGSCSNYIERESLSSQMLLDYDSAIGRAFVKIGSLPLMAIPDRCDYRFEQEVCEMAKCE